MAEFTAGQKPTAAELSRRGFLAYGRRDTSSLTSSTATDVGILRIDNIPIINLRPIIINITGHPTSSVGTDNTRTNIRGSTSGTATTGSGILTSGQWFQKLGDPVVFRFVYFPATTGLLSVLACIARDAGSGAVSYYADGVRNFEMWMENMNVITNTGVPI